MPGVHVGRRQRRLDREAQVEQPEADGQLGDGDLVLPTLEREDHPERGQGAQVVLAELPAGAGRQLGAGHLDRPLHVPRRQHRPGEREVLGVASAGMPATYFSIAERVKPWLCSPCTSSSRPTWIGE